MKNLNHFPPQDRGRRPLRALLTAALVLAAAAVGAAGCAEYVAYDEDFQFPGGSPTTLEGFMPTTLDHLLLRGLIARYLSRSADGVYVLVDYDAMAASREALFTLDQYRSVLASTNPSSLATTSERLAYWVNGYNASVLHGVIYRYKGNHNFRTNDDGHFFNDPVFTFGGQLISLNNLEQGVMRGDWGYSGMPPAGTPDRIQLETWHKELWGDAKPDARLHAVINCGAVSCPNLLDKVPYVYEAETIDAQMTAANKAWLDSPEKGAGPNGISELFKWYKSDYERSHQSVDNFIKTYRTGGLQGVNTSTYVTYDWTLNIKGAK